MWCDIGKFDAKYTTPMLVEFTDTHVKTVVMGDVGLLNLGSASIEFEGVAVSHDITIKETEWCKRFVDKGKKKQSEDWGDGKCCLSSERSYRAIKDS